MRNMSRPPGEHAGQRRRQRRARGFSLVLAAAALVIALVAAGCGGSEKKSGSGGTIKVGLLWPFNGFASNYGPDGKAGVELALKQAGMEVGDKKIQLVTANENVLDPSQTLQAAKKLVQQDGAEVVLGPVFGSSQQAVGRYFASRKVLSIVPYTATRELAQTGTYVSWPSLDTNFATPLGDYLYDKLGYRSIATLAPDYVYGKNLIEGAVKPFVAAGGKVAQSQKVPLGTTDLLPYASHLSRNVDALVMWLVPQDAASFVKAYKSLRIKVPLIMINGIFDPTFQEIGSQVEGTLGLMDWSLGIKNAENTKFVSEFRKANNDTAPNNNNAAAFANAQIMLAALEKSGGSTNVDELRKALQSIEVQTPYGPAKFDKLLAGVTSRTVVKATRESDGHYVWAPVETFDFVPGS